MLYQPWEFGRVPKRWVEEVRRRVDEVWAPSEAARAAFVASGVAPDLVHVVPNGIDPAHFTPEGPARALPTRKSTVLLFVGGMTYRKGIDILLEAYGRAFTSDDDVCLVLKAFGSRTFYKARRPRTPSARSSPWRLAGARAARRGPVVRRDPALYRACDVLVQPYRGEGFCLPALEALAWGGRSIVTDGGSTDDFVRPSAAGASRPGAVPLPDGSLPPEYELGGRGLPARPDPRRSSQPSVPPRDPVRAGVAGCARARQAERFTWEPTGVSPLLASRRCAIAGRSVRSRRPPCPTAAASSSSSPPTGPSRETWAAPLRAYAEAFRSGDDTTLVLPTLDEAEALQLASAELEAGGYDLETLADICIADRSATVTEALELAADAMICANGYRPTRARLVIAPDPAALRAAARRR